MLIPRTQNSYDLHPVFGSTGKAAVFLVGPPLVKDTVVGDPSEALESYTTWYPEPRRAELRELCKPAPELDKLAEHTHLEGSLATALRFSSPALGAGPGACLELLSCNDQLLGFLAGPRGLLPAKVSQESGVVTANLPNGGTVTIDQETVTVQQPEVGVRFQFDGDKPKRVTAFHEEIGWLSTVKLIPSWTEASVTRTQDGALAISHKDAIQGQSVVTQSGQAVATPRTILFPFPLSYSLDSVPAEVDAAKAIKSHVLDRLGILTHESG